MSARECVCARESVCVCVCVCIIVLTGADHSNLSFSGTDQKGGYQQNKSYQRGNHHTHSRD